MKSVLGLAALYLFLAACASTSPYYSSGFPPVQMLPPADSIAGTVFFTGGVTFGQSNPVLSAIRQQDANEAALILLGDALSIDDVYETSGDDLQLSPSALAELKQLDDQFSTFFLVPGEKEWTSEKTRSVRALSALDKATKDVKRKGRLLVPAKNCSEPEVVRISDHVVVVLIDSQWALEAEAHPGQKITGCDLTNVLELRMSLKDIVQSYPADHIILAAHHPVFTNGKTAGNYPVSSHLLPLPGIGSLITGIKTLTADYEHFNHPAYEAYRSVLQYTMERCPNCCMVSGHEPNLQYYVMKDRHYAVAGSGADVGYARKGEGASFSYMSNGFLRSDELDNGDLVQSVFAVGKDGAALLVFQSRIKPTRQLPQLPDSLADNNITGESALLLPASLQYEHKQFLRGNFYRKAWSLPIEMPVFYLDSTMEGLSPKKLGGGNQTRSLRLENDAGEQYVLRSIDKKVTAVLPPSLRGSLAENIVQDGVAASHPYGALVIPGLAKAANVYYTNPRVVYVPHQTALGIYDQDIGDGVYLFEERPGGRTDIFENFGHTDKTFSTADVLDLLAEDARYRVDELSVCRARLFDIWLGDWDRHDDQWRWASFEEDGSIVLRPIPRDRDQVFFNNDGFLDYLASRPYFNPALRRFAAKIHHLDGLVWSGKYFDRSFLHQLTEDDFVQEAVALQQSLTDDIIDAAFKRWPASIDRLDGDRIRHDLKQRRDDLLLYAKDYYRLLSREVFIPGTLDKDEFTIRTIAADKIEVTVDRLDQDEKHRFYHRIFKAEETKELRLFGLKKQDVFRVAGDAPSRTLVRIIGGTGVDVVKNENHAMRLKLYDSREGMTLSGFSANRHFNSSPANNEYDRTDWNLNRSIHYIVPGFYTDEGIGLTYHFLSTRYGFRSDPYASKHATSLSYYFLTGSFIGGYRGDWKHALGPVDFGMRVHFTGPTFVQFFYGLGNGYFPPDENRKYYVVSGGQIRLNPSFRYRFGFGHSVSLSPVYQYYDIDEDDDEDEPRFIRTPESGLTAANFGVRHYAGLGVTYRFERLDNSSFPSRGIEFEAGILGRSRLGDIPTRHVVLAGEGSLYLPFDANNRLVLSTHLGGGKIYGEYEFFQAFTLGGVDKVRGYRTDRFAGNAMFYQSTDLRYLFFDQRGMVPFKIGIYGSLDYGRVWYEEDPSSANHWHVSCGGGLFVVPFDVISFRLGYMRGERDQQFIIGGSLRL